MRALLIFAALVVAEVALAGGYGTEQYSGPDVFGFTKGVGFWLVALHFGLRLVAEILTHTAKWTEARWDNRLAETVTRLAWWLGKMIGKFGYDVPRLVRREMAEQNKVA